MTTDRLVIHRLMGPPAWLLLQGLLLCLGPLGASAETAPATTAQPSDEQPSEGEALAARQGLESTTVMIEQMRKNAIAVVHRLERTGTLIPAGRDGHGATWSVA